MITAPYNFVPLNKEIFYPEWSKRVSHDIPFKDGESGEIGITITTKSPLFIRNHYQDGDEFYEDKEKNKISKEFCHIKTLDGGKQFYIPGSSIKGMIRSVLEILSFGKIKIDENTLKKTLSVRDMTNQRELVGGAKGCGFLVKVGNKYKIEDCGKIITISHLDLKQTYRDIKKLETAKDKYKKFGRNKVKFEIYKKMMNVKGKQIPKTMAKIDNSSNKNGTLVFSGDIKNKKHEFVFKSPEKDIDISTNIFSNFSKVYFDNEDSVDGQFWKKEFKKENTKIPIFYQKNRNTQEIEAIGLTQLFKLAYSKTLFEAAKQNNDENELDLAQTIFGNHTEDLSLKGRVQFSHQKSTTIRYEKEVEQVLGTPNPSYYPNYIRQVDVNGNVVTKYSTLMDKNAEISGWKRYPLQNSIQSYPLPKNDNGKINHDVTTNFKPLEVGNVFQGKLRFHNLKKVEIGALLSAITFHGQNENYMHNIGMAKSLGYGKINIKLNNYKYLKHSVEDYLKAYEEEMNRWGEKDYDNWIDSPQLTELFSMADTSKEKVLKYQQLDNPKSEYNIKGKQEKNEFIGAKKNKEYLIPNSSKIYMQGTVSTNIKEKKQNREESTLQSSIISNTKMNKAILKYWEVNFGTRYHKNQINEFFSNNGFNTTPLEQRKIYDEHKDNETFIKILKAIKSFNDKKLNESQKQSLYNYLIRENIKKQCTQPN